MGLNIYFQKFGETLAFGWGNDVRKLLFYLSLIVILLFEDNKTRKKIILIYIVAALLIIYCPFTTFLVNKLFFSDTIEIIAYYSRLFVAFPTVFLIAYAIILISKRTEGKKSYVVIVLLVFSIMSAHMFVYDFNRYSVSDNTEKVSHDVKQISDSLKDVDGYKNVLMPIVPNEFLRTIDTSIITPYSKDNIDEYWLYPAVRQISGRDPLVVEDVCQFCDDNNCDFIVLKDDDAKLFEEAGYEEYTRTDAYTILRVKHID